MTPRLLRLTFKEIHLAAQAGLTIRNPACFRIDVVTRPGWIGEDGSAISREGGGRPVACRGLGRQERRVYGLALKYRVTPSSFSTRYSPRQPFLLTMAMYRQGSHSSALLLVRSLVSDAIRSSPSA